MPNAHSNLPASASARWIHCPGSIRLSRECPEPAASDYAREGTLAHALAELKIRLAMDKTVDADELKTITKDPMYDGEMMEATDFYCDLVMERYNAAGPDAELMVEQRVDFSGWVPGGWGTSDAVIIAGDTIEIVDLKYGKGIRVDAKDNSQMRLYALGAYSIFGDLYDFTRVRMTIVQPRLDHISSDEMIIDELLTWAEDVVRPAAKAALSDDGAICAGDWCRWCPAKAICRARAEKNLELAQYDFADPALLTNSEVADILRRVDEFNRWVADVSEYALTEALAGATFDGFKVVEGRSNRKYKDELKAAEALQKVGFSEAVLYERKLLGITAMEKLVGKKKFAETLKDLIEKPQGKPALVPESDPREPYKKASAADDFSESF